MFSATTLNYRPLIRPYTSTDTAALIELLRLNTPDYFAPSEEADFIEYLQLHAAHYFVVEKAGRIVGSGGYNFADGPSIARISWDIIHPDFHGQGIGRELVRYRIADIQRHPGVDTIIVRTSQLAYRFYQKMGFELLKTVRDHWAPGFDLYEMRLRSPVE